MMLAWLLPHFESLSPLLTSKLCPSRCFPGADSWVGGLVYILDLVGPSSGLSCETGSFSHLSNAHRFLQPEVLRLYFPTLKPWVTQLVSLPSSSQFIHMRMWNHPVCQLLPCPPCSPTTHHLAVSSPPQVRVSTPPTSLDECFFLTLVVGFPHSLIFLQFWLFLFLNWFLSFFWFCEEVKRIYLRLHLGWMRFLIE